MSTQRTAVRRSSSLRRAGQVAATRAQILRAAASCFAARGFERATMTEIAEAAGFTAASLYTYFEGKQQILDAMLDDFMASLAGALDAPIPSDLDDAHKLELLTARQLRIVDERRETVLVFAAEQARTSKRKAQDIVAYARLLERWIRKNLSAATLGDRSAEDAAFLVVGVGYASFLRWAGGGGSTKLERRAGDVVDAVLYGLCGAPGAAKKR